MSSPSLSDFSDETKNYLERKGIKKDGDLKVPDTEDYKLGLSDLRTRLGFRTIIILIFVCIFAAISLGLFSTIFAYIYNEDSAKSFRINHEKLLKGCYGVGAVLLLLIILLLGLWLIFYRKSFETEDAVLTDISRIALNPLSDEELNGGLTDLIANRAQINNYQRALLHQNLMNNFGLRDPNRIIGAVGQTRLGLQPEIQDGQVVYVKKNP